MSYFVELNDWIEIKVSGPQRIEYLNGIITKDLLQVKNGEVVRSAFLTPKAKIRSVYWLKKEEDAIYFYCPAEMKKALVEDLLKYKLSMDVTLEDITEESNTLYLITSDLKIPGLSNGDIGFEFVHATTEPDGERLAYPEFIDLLIDSGIIPPNSLMADQNPYELGIDDVISLEKGCFLGQEPISRMYHRGNPRQYVYQVEFDGKDNSESKLMQGDDEVGQILITTKNKGLAYIRRTIDDFDNITTPDNTLVKVKQRIGSYPVNDRK